MTSTLHPLNRLRAVTALAAALAFLPLTASDHPAQAQPPRYAPAYGYRTQRNTRNTPTRTYRRSYGSTRSTSGRTYGSYSNTPARTYGRTYGSYSNTPGRTYGRSYGSTRTTRVYSTPGTRTRGTARYRR